MKPTAILLAGILGLAVPLTAQTQKEEAAEQVQTREGDLTEAEIDGLVNQARRRLKRDMAKLDERSQRNSLERDAEDRAEEAWEIKNARFRASLRALERDLLYRIARLRKPGGDKFEDPLDDVQDRVKDTFADLHDKIDDDEEPTWPGTLDTARRFHKEFGKQVDAWASKIGVNADVPNALEIVVARKEALIERLVRLRKLGGNKYEDGFDALEERIYDSFENLEEKLEDAPPANWGQVVKDADKFHANYTAELDGWAEQIGVDENLPSPIERLARLKRELVGQIKDLRRIGGDEYEDVIDEIADRVDDTFADLKDKILDSDRKAHAGILETASKYHQQFGEILDLWERKIIGASEGVDRHSPESPGERGIVEDYPEKDVDLPEGVHMDIVGGVRVSRLLPMPRKQLNLDHGLSVNEVVDADDVLARAGVKVHDIILKVNGKAVDTRTDLRNAVDNTEEDKEFEVEVLREGKRQTLKANK